jgi:uncharacterized protein (DUF4213/DUF364 family)
MADPPAALSVDDHLREIEGLMKRIQGHVDAIRDASAPKKELLIAALLKVTEEVAAKRAGSDPDKLRQFLTMALSTDPAHTAVSDATIRAVAEKSVPTKPDGSYDLNQVACNVELLAYELAKAGAVPVDRVNRLPGSDSDAFSNEAAKDAIKRGADRAKTEKGS